MNPAHTLHAASQANTTMPNRRVFTWAAANDAAASAPSVPQTPDTLDSLCKHVFSSVIEQHRNVRMELTYPSVGGDAGSELCLWSTAMEPLLQRLSRWCATAPNNFMVLGVDVQTEHGRLTALVHLGNAALADAAPPQSAPQAARGHPDTDAGLMLAAELHRIREATHLLLSQNKHVGPERLTDLIRRAQRMPSSDSSRLVASFARTLAATGCVLQAQDASDAWVQVGLTIGGAGRSIQVRTISEPRRKLAGFRRKNENDGLNLRVVFLDGQPSAEKEK